MTSHAVLDEDSRTQAALYVLGALEEAEIRAYEAHLDACALCRREVAELRRVTDELALVPVATHPSPRVRDSLLAFANGEGFYLLRRDEGQWLPSGVPGVDLRILFIDREARRQTLLLRMAAGSSFPCHRHDQGFEECLVLEGDVADGHAAMSAGDFIRYPADTEHGPLTTVHGNLLLITAGLEEHAA
ncbi:MAG: cupin domain-containing protein [Acidobacteriota bacterium]